MKDSEYYGFSTDDNCDDFKVVDLNDEDVEDDFRVIDLVNFDTEEDVRIVALADCERGQEQYEDEMNLPSISALKPRSTRRRHIVQSVMVVGLVCAFLLVFLGNSTLVRTAVASRFTTATPHQALAQTQTSEPMTLAIDTDRFYIAPSVPGEPISIDGRVLSHVPLIGVDPPLHLTYGHHTLLWRTSSRRVMTCTVSVPPSFSDTCAYDGPQPLPTGLAVWIISVPHSEFEMP